MLLHTNNRMLLITKGMRLPTNNRILLQTTKRMNLSITKSNR